MGQKSGPISPGPLPDSARGTILACLATAAPTSRTEGKTDDPFSWNNGNALIPQISLPLF